MNKPIAIIPARSGSKRIKNKNLRLFNNKPMIHWTIKKLVNSNLFSQVIVSTDSKKIAMISKKCGADVPYIRSKKLSDDFTTTQAVIEDAIYRLKINSKIDNYIFCVYPCSPLLDIADLIKAIKLIKKNDCEFVVPISEYSHPIQRAFKLKNKRIKFNKISNYIKRTQDHEKYFHDAGQFYLGKTRSWLKRKNIFKYCQCIEIPNWRAVDIDNENDWIKSELIFKSLKKFNKHD